MIILDQTIVNVALPSIQQDLGFSQSSLAWVVNAYLIAFGGLLLLAGRLGDLVGRKRIFLGGLALFTLASLLCGAAQSQDVLVAARFVQGVGGALTSAVILGMIVTLFPRPDEQAKAIGVFSFVAAAGASIGLLAGGVLTAALNWHWIFFVNVPIGIATAFLARRLLAHEDGIGLDRGADLPGALLIVGALMLAVYTIVEVPNNGWASAETLGLGALAVALLAGFVAREATAAHPLVPLRIFRAPQRDDREPRADAAWSPGCSAMFFLGALYLQRVLGYGALDVGLAFLPVALGIATLSLGVSARLILRFGGRATLMPGLVLAGPGLLLFSRVPVDATYLRDLLPAMLLLGIGVGLAFPALTSLAMSGATPSESGLASGLFQTTQQVGAALGLAVLATLSTTRTESLRAAGDSASSALTSGYHLAFTIAVAPRRRGPRAGRHPPAARDRAGARGERRGRPRRAARVLGGVALTSSRRGVRGGRAGQFAREELHRGAGLRLLLARRVDAALVEEDPHLGGHLERLGGRAARRQLEDARPVRVEPQLGDEAAAEVRGRGLQLEDEHRPEHTQIVEADPFRRVLGEERALTLAEHLAQRRVAVDVGEDPARADDALERPRADEPARHRVDLDGEGRVGAQAGRDLLRHDRPELHGRVLALALDTAGAHHDPGSCSVRSGVSKKKT